MNHLPNIKKYIGPFKRKKCIGTSKGYINNVNKFYTNIGLFNLLIYYNIEWTLIGNIIRNKMMKYNQILVKHVYKICICI